MLVIRALSGIKSNGTAFGALLAGVLYDKAYRPLYADPDVWMRLGLKANGLKY